MERSNTNDRYNRSSYNLRDNTNPLYNVGAPPSHSSSSSTHEHITASENINFHVHQRSSSESTMATSNYQQPQPSTTHLTTYHRINGHVPLAPSKDASAQQIFIAEPDEDPMQHLVLLPLGKTGAGKSSLLNVLLGNKEFKVKAAAMSVTDSITERTGVWNIDRTETIVTVADTPGFADSKHRDQDFLLVFQEYIQELGNRIGIDSFLLVFQCNSPANGIMSILEHFQNMMVAKFPDDLTHSWWDYVLLVFTQVDYYPSPIPTHIMLKKMNITDVVLPAIQKKFSLSSLPKYAFVSSKELTCSYYKNGQCDCSAAKKYRFDQMILLKSGINASISEKNGKRWRPVVNL